MCLSPLCLPNLFPIPFLKKLRNPFIVKYVKSACPSNEQKNNILYNMETEASHFVISYSEFHSLSLIERFQRKGLFFPTVSHQH